MTTPTDPITATAAVIADSSDPAAIREAGTAAAAAAVVMYRRIAEAAADAAAILDAAAARMLDGDDAADRLMAVGPIGSALIADARDARQLLTLASEAADVLNYPTCIGCGEVMHQGDPRAYCYACYAAPGGPGASEDVNY